jgi:heat shock protein HslJ
MKKTFGAQQLGLLSCGAIATLGVLVGSASEPVQARETALQVLAQQETEEPEDNCIAFQEVTTGQTEIRKRIENRVITRGNWNTDFLVPNTQEFDYFVAIITPENTAPYEFTAHLRLPGGGAEPAFSGRSDVEAGTAYSIPFQSPTGRQPVVINARVGGVNGNFYTISMVGCQTGSASTNSALTGKTWELQQIQFNDGRLLTPESPQNYTVEFTSAGEVLVQADCNRAIGGFTQAADSRISITMGPTTLAACPPNSISDDFLRALDNANLYFFRGNDLFIDLKFDSGTMQFSPAN